MRKKTKTKIPGPPEKKGSALKTVITIILLLVVGGLVFFFGLVKVDLKPGQVAVFYSKTKGFSEKLIMPGDFVWKWEKLLPTNTELFVFTVTPYRLEIDRSSILPSGDVYGSYIGENTDFSFRFKAAVIYQVKQDKLAYLCAEANLRPDTVDQWYEDLASKVTNSAVAFVQEYGKNEVELRAVAYDFKKMAEDLKVSLEQEINTIEISDIVPQEINFPDVSLYLSARDAYLASMKIREETRNMAMQSIASGEIESDTRLSILSKYGEVFNKYPELLQFFNISPESAAEWLPEIKRESAAAVNPEAEAGEEPKIQ